MKVYYSNIDEFADLAGSERLTPARRSRMQRYFQPEDQQRSLVAGLLLRAALGIDEAMCIERDPNGKLFLPGGPFFNLTHGGDIVALAVADCEVGVDVEDIRAYSDEVASQCFTPDELKWMRGQADPEQAFYVLWTGKESIMKATGQGFRLEPESFSIMPIEHGLHRVAGGAWHLSWKRIDDHVLCVASALPGSMRLEHVSRDVLLGPGDHILGGCDHDGAALGY